jgi:hypothetical protein
MKRAQTRTLALAFLGAVLVAPAAHAACALTTDDFTGDGIPDLKIVANTSKQNLVLTVGAASSTVSLDCNGDGDDVDATLGDIHDQVYPLAFGTYLLHLGGSDVITINIPADMTAVAKVFQVTLGPGKNTVTINGAGATLRGQSRLTIDVAGYLDNDKLTATLPGADASAITLRTDLSLGNDQVNLVLGGEITNGAVVDVDAVLSLGSNVFSLAQPASQSITDSTLSVGVEGGPNLDLVTTSFAGSFDGTARVTVSADLGAGNDKYTGTFDLTTFDVTAGAEARFDVSGGGGNDTITFTRNGTAGGASTINAGLLDFHADGGIGTDTITLDLGGGGFQMNNGTLALRASGGPGNDKIDATLVAEAGSTNPVFDVVLNGGRQNDTITLTLDNNSASDTAANYGPAGMALLDGSDGIDVCTVAGVSALHVHKRSCP